MSNPAAPETSSPTTPSAAQTLQDFLTEKGIELRLSPPVIKQVEGGGIMIDQPQILANFKETNSIKTN